jgi:trehalose 2-sulfotransferase
MAELKPIRFVTDERLDFNHHRPLRKSYIVASSYRCGSQYLCWRLWQTGRLGAPSEVLNPANELKILMNRFKVSSPSDYISELLLRRTSRNGIFGMKAHFHHFDAFLKKFPALLETMAPITYIFINRPDKIAQAVSMAKALQTGWWTSRMEQGPRPPLRYDREMIADCLKQIEQQDLGWRQWFEERRITPFQVTYDQLTADADAVVGSIVELLGVENDQPDQVNVPPAKKQSDETNEEWIARFERDMVAGREQEQVGSMEAGATVPTVAATPDLSAAEEHFLNRYDRLVRNASTGSNSATGFIDVIRLRRRYDAIISRNRPLLQYSRVLDIASGYGFWSLAALDAGAAQVVGVEPSRTLVEAAEKNFTAAGMSAKRYKFIRSDVSTCLQTLQPEQFDVVLCEGFLEQCYLPQFFNQLSRLRPKHVILDTRIASGRGPTARFAIAPGGRHAITSTPSHDLIAFLCEPDFRCRLVDWQATGITDWTGVQDYARNSRRTYVLDRL